MGKVKMATKKQKPQQISMMDMLDPYEREKKRQQENFYRAKLETLYMQVRDRYGLHHKDMPDGLVVIVPMSRWVNDESETHWYRCVVGHHGTIRGEDIHLINAPNKEWPDEPIWQPHHGVRWIYPEGTLWTRKEPEMDVRKDSAMKILLLQQRSELLTSMPELRVPFTCYFFREGAGVLGEFTCDDKDYQFTDSVTNDWLKDTMLTVEEMQKIVGNSRMVYKWRIRSLIIYPEPRPLSRYGIDEPPQEWCYVKDGDPDGKQAEQTGCKFGDMPVMREA